MKKNFRNKNIIYLCYNNLGKFSPADQYCKSPEMSKYKL